MTNIATVFKRLQSNRVEKSDLPCRMVISEVAGKRVIGEDGKTFPLSFTLAKQLIDMTGKLETDDWKGLEIELFWDETVKFGKGKTAKVIGGMRVREPTNETA